MYIGSITMHPLDPFLSVNHPVNQARSTPSTRHGETNATGDTFYGTGIYVSRDAGRPELAQRHQVQAVNIQAAWGTFTLTFKG